VTPDIDPLSSFRLDGRLPAGIEVPAYDQRPDQVAASSSAAQLRAPGEPLVANLRYTVDR
jgi:hypothetical protein